MKPFPLALLVVLVMLLSSPHYGLVIGGVNIAFLALLIPCIRYMRSIDIKLVLSLFLFVGAILNGVYQIYQNCGSNCSTFVDAPNPVFYVAASGIRYFLAFYIYFSMKKWKFLSSRHIDLVCRFIINYFFVVIIFQLASFELGYQFGEYFWAGLVYGGIRFDALYGEPFHIHSWLIPAFVIFTINRGTIDYQSLAKVLVVAIACFSLAWLTILIVFLLYFRFGARGLALTGLAGSVASLMFLSSFIDFRDLKFFLELSEVNERTITYFAGWELYVDRWLFGYGVGASPYLLPLTDWFANYPFLDLSTYGRQNIMSTPLMVLYELGLVGIIAFVFLLLILVGDVRFRSARVALGIIFLPYMFVGSGLVASPFIYSCIGLYFCKKSSNHREEPVVRRSDYQSNLIV